jgi:hypothetical protein
LESSKKKRPFGNTSAPSLSRSTSKTENANSKKKRRTTASTPMASSDNLLSPDASADLPLFDDEDDLFFGSESFEDQHSRPVEQVNASMVNGSYNNSIDTLAELHRQQSNTSMEVEVRNEAAWLTAPAAESNPRSARSDTLHDREEEDDDNLWSEAAVELKAKRADYDSFG